MKTKKKKTHKEYIYIYFIRKLIRIDYLNLFVKNLKTIYKAKITQQNSTRIGVCMEEDIDGARCKKKGLSRIEM